MKAFKCTDVHMDIEGYYAADTAGEARYLMYLAKDDALFEPEFSDFKVKRAPEMDYIIKGRDIIKPQSLAEFIPCH